MIPLEGKVAVVTGAASGLGVARSEVSRGLAIMLASEAANYMCGGCLAK
ncbi:MAG: hypothetical protein ACRDSJ_04425 [Rubrobacteraceae bacterium]